MQRFNRNETAGICKEDAVGKQEMGFLKHGHHSCLPAAVSFSLVAYPLLTTHTACHTRFGDPVLMKGKEVKWDPGKVHRRPKKTSMKSEGGELI